MTCRCPKIDQTLRMASMAKGEVGIAPASSCTQFLVKNVYLSIDGSTERGKVQRTLVVAASSESHQRLTCSFHEIISLRILRNTYFNDMERQSSHSRKSMCALDHIVKLASCNSITYTCSLTSRMMRVRTGIYVWLRRQCLVSHKARALVLPFPWEGLAGTPRHVPPFPQNSMLQCGRLARQVPWNARDS